MTLRIDPISLSRRLASCGGASCLRSLSSLFLVGSITVVEAADLFKGKDLPMKMFSASLTGLAMLLASGLPAHAGFTAQAILTGPGEVPPNASAATGLFIVTYDSVANTLQYTETFSGLAAPAGAAHIHFGDPGIAGPIILPFTNPGPPATTSATFSGTLTSADFIPRPAVGINTFADAINAIQTGHTYANIHDATYPGGEIRGQISVVPEPATLTLMALGLVVTAGVCRHRRRLAA